MPGFLITVQPHRDAPWEIASWKQQRDHADELARKLVKPPYLNIGACVVEVGGSISWGPIFFPESVLTRQEQG